jgi:shikimate dehydrogenase
MQDQYAVTGNPLGHTKSPLIHTTFARQTGQDMVYQAIEAPPGGFEDVASAFRARGGRGMNITTPFKLDAFAYATEKSDRARLAGASNALKFDGDRVVAENFDGVGLVNDIQENLGFRLNGRRVLMIGAGGAARGAMLPVLAQQPGYLFVANRDLTKLQSFQREFLCFGTFDVGNYADLGKAQFDVVINATSASFWGHLPPVTPRVFADGCLAYDLVYAKGLTPFLRLARDAGAAHIADGVGMLVEQAAEAFVWWRGVRPDTRAMINQLTVELV